MTTNNDWLTPETAIGARLPCGAVVESAERQCEFIVVRFAKLPRRTNGAYSERRGPFWFSADGTSGGAFPDLIPPTQQPTPMADLSLSTLLANARIDRAAIVAAVVAVSDAVAHESAERIGHMVADKLGCPPDAPKVAPWEAAFREWEALGMTDTLHRAVWKAAVEWHAGYLFAADGQIVSVTRHEDTIQVDYNNGTTAIWGAIEVRA